MKKPSYLSQKHIKVLEEFVKKEDNLLTLPLLLRKKFPELSNTQTLDITLYWIYSNNVGVK